MSLPRGSRATPAPGSSKRQHSNPHRRFWLSSRVEWARGTSLQAETSPHDRRCGANDSGRCVSPCGSKLEATANRILKSPLPVLPAEHPWSPPPQVRVHHNLEMYLNVVPPAAENEAQKPNKSPQGYVLSPTWALTAGTTAPLPTRLKRGPGGARGQHLPSLS